MKVLEDEKEMEVVEMIVHTEEEDLEMKQEQVEKAQKRFSISISHLCNCDQICRWNLLKTVLRAIFAMSLVGGLSFTVKGYP